jgi:hypothetical protein
VYPRNKSSQRNDENFSLSGKEKAKIKYSITPLNTGNFRREAKAKENFKNKLKDVSI